MPVEFHPAVAGALAQGQPVVALESTLICHGLPRPRNLELALAVEAAVRAAGAVPATIAVMDGLIRVGLDDRSSSASPTPTAWSNARHATCRWSWRSVCWVPPRWPAPSGSRPRPASGSWLPVASAASIAAASAASTCRPTCRSSPAAGWPCSAAVPRSSSTCRGPWRCWRPWRSPWSAMAVPPSPPSTRATAAWRHPGSMAWPNSWACCRPRTRSAGLAAWSWPTRRPRLWRCSRPSWRRGSPRGSTRPGRRGIAGKEETPFLLAELARRSGGRTVTLNEALVLGNARLAAAAAVAWRSNVTFNLNAYFS